MFDILEKISWEQDSRPFDRCKTFNDILGSLDGQTKSPPYPLLEYESECIPLPMESEISNEGNKNN